MTEHRDSRGRLASIDGVSIHHHPDNKPSPELDALVRAAVGELGRRSFNLFDEAAKPRRIPAFINPERWLGIPWVMNGETRTGADCWGLVKLVYAHELGLELVHASESTTAAAAESARRLQMVKELILGQVRFRPLGDEQPWQDFDIVEIALGGGEADHVAIVAGGMLLHSRAGIGSHGAPIARYQDRIRGAWRLV